MKFRTVDELGNFNVKGAHITEIYTENGHFYMILDDVKILVANSCNRDICDKRTNGLSLKLQDGEIMEFISEGYKVYDADGNLKSSEPDTAVAEKDYQDMFKSLAEQYVYAISKTGDIYQIDLDGEENTFCIKVKAGHDVEEWDKFLSMEPA